MDVLIENEFALVKYFKHYLFEICLYILFNMCAIAIINNTYSSVNLLQLNVNHINFRKLYFL